MGFKARSRGSNLGWASATGKPLVTTYVAARAAAESHIAASYSEVPIFHRIGQSRPTG